MFDASLRLESQVGGEIAIVDRDLSFQNDHVSSLPRVRTRGLRAATISTRSMWPLLQIKFYPSSANLTQAWKVV